MVLKQIFEDTVRAIGAAFLDKSDVVDGTDYVERLPEDAKQNAVAGVGLLITAFAVAIAAKRFVDYLRRDPAVSSEANTCAQDTPNSHALQLSSGVNQPG